MNEKLKKQISVGYCFKQLMVYSGILLMVLSATMAQAQTKVTMTGKIVSAEDQVAVPGANIIIKGTTNGTISNMNGEFSIDANKGDILVISFMGFATQEITVADETKLSIALVEDVSDLDEVVVIGYGVQRKKLVTGATVQVKGDDVVKTSNTSLLTAIQGQTAGVNISSISGQPGEGFKVNIRGVGTIGNSGPLYLVDGVQTGDISYLNNSDIESIDILKDAASAAIYGSQAANGVVLITTKSGSKGKMSINFDSYVGRQRVGRKIDMLDSKEYAVIMNEAAINSGKSPYFSMDEINAMGEGTDWIDEMIYDDAVTQNYALGINGGSNVSTFSASIAYTNQEGIVGGPKVSNYERYSFRINSEHKIYKDIVKMGQHLTMSYMKRNGISVGDQYNNTLRSAFNTSPLLPMHTDWGAYVDNSSDSEQGAVVNGQPYEPWNPDEGNPYASMVYNNQRRNNNQKLLGDIYLNISPKKGLNIRSSFAFDYYGDESRSYRPIYQLSTYSRRTYDEVRQGMSKGLALQWNNTISYDMNIGDHDITGMAGMEARRNRGNYINITNGNLLTTSNLGNAYINNTDKTDYNTLSYNGAPNDEEMLLSYFGRVSYNFKETYMLNVTFRADGSSKFAKDNRWGYFPSVSAGWVLSNESFMQGTQSFMDFFKLRASWGQVGNQSIKAWQYYGVVHVGSGTSDYSDGNYYFGTADFDVAGNTVGAYQARLANPEVMWETSEQLNIGFDARFVNDKLGANFDWYKKTTKDWLLEKPAFGTQGALPPFFNGGNVENTGLELALNWNDKIGDIQYFISANIAYNENEVTSVPTEDGIVHGKTNMLYDNSGEFYRRAEVGYPIGYFWGWETNGIFQNEEEVANHVSSNGTQIQPNAQPGDLRYRDQNDDGVINDLDKSKIGDPSPDVSYGFNVGLSYKGFDFSVMANGVGGNQIVQTYRNHANSYANYTSEILGRWHGEGTSTTIPRVTETNSNYLFSDIFVKDGDYLRISNITLGYDFTKLSGSKLLKQLRLYASVQNAFTFTKYNGMDPEVGFGITENNITDGSAGIDVGFYPRPRTYLMGVNIKF